jgi:hypothetical protein
MDHPYVHLATLVCQIITLALLFVALAWIRRLCRERDEAVKQLMLHIDRKARELEDHHNGLHKSA